MATFKNLISGIQALFRKEQRSQEMSEELLAFEQASTQEKIRNGLNPQEAQRAARIEMGSIETVKHKVRSATWESTAESIWYDIRFSLRMMAKSPGFTAVAILSLALGIGANTAIFTLINNLLLKQLPVRDPRQLVSFGKGDGRGTMDVSGPGPIDIFPYDFYQRLEQRQTFFEGITSFASFPTMVSVRLGSTGNGPATQAITHLVSGTFFSLLGADPQFGRPIAPSDTDAPGRSPVAVISHRYWQQALAADPSVIGRTLTINGAPFTIVGVMPEKFYGVDLNEQAPDMWLPLTMQHEVMQQASLLQPGGLFWLHFMARRNPGISLEQAQSWVTAQLQQFMTERAGVKLTEASRKNISHMFVPLLPGETGLSHLRSAYQAPLAALMGIVGIVLLIACANLANFLLAKAASREREFSTRLALGSSRSRLLRQVLTETLLLAFIGGVLGLLFAFWGTRLLIRFLVGNSAHTALTAAPDMHVLAFTSGICILAGLCFGIAPALRISRISVAGTLSSNTRTAASAGGPASRLLPRALVTGQVALSLVLLVIAGLFLRTLHNLRSQDLGFNRTNVLLVRINPRFAGYKPEQLNALYDRILTRIDALPGVHSSALSGAPAMGRGTWGSPIIITGRTNAPNEDVSTLLNRVTAGYFETLGIPLLRGRTIDASDSDTSLKAVVVNQTLANRYFPNGDAIGHTFTVADPAVIGTWRIVGIVRDAKYNSPAEDPQPMSYLAVPQLTGDDHYAFCLQILTVGDPARIAGEVRSALIDVDPNLAILDAITIYDTVDHLIDIQRLVSQLSTFFSLLALSLACIGLYGVMTYNVVRRTNEIGVRIALGAAKGNVLWMILKESLLLLAIGIALGVPATLAASRAVQSGLFGLSSSDPLTLVVAILIIAAVTLIAAWFPARRATRVDPIVALRYE